MHAIATKLLLTGVGPPHPYKKCHQNMLINYGKILLTKNDYKHKDRHTQTSLHSQSADIKQLTQQRNVV